MVQWMCEAHPDISSIISIPGNKGMNCLHIGINKRIKFLHLLIDKAKPEAITAKDDNGNTPLHLAVDYNNCKRDQFEYVRMMLEKGDRVISVDPVNDFNKSNLSPYLYHKKSVRDGQKKAKEGTEMFSKDTESAPNRGISSSTPQIVFSGSSIRPDARENIQIDHRSKYGGGNPDQGFPRRGSLAPSTAPVAPAESKVAPHSGSSKPKKSKSGGKSDPVNENIVRGVERLLKLHYLRSRDCTTAMEILYGKNTPSGKTYSHSCQLL